MDEEKIVMQTQQKDGEVIRCGGDFASPWSERAAKMKVDERGKWMCGTRVLKLEEPDPNQWQLGTRNINQGSLSG